MSGRVLIPSAIQYVEPLWMGNLPRGKRRFYFALMRRVLHKSLSSGVLPILILLLSSTLNVAAAAPSITSLSPTSGAVGASVTITGTNFGSTQGASTVAFNGTAATLTSWSARLSWRRYPQERAQAMW